MHKACVVVALAGAAGIGAGVANADAFNHYGSSWRTFDTPPIGNGSFGVFGAALPDGRLVMVTGNSVYLESAPGSAAFDEVARLDTSMTGGATDPSFLCVSPGGGRIAVGAGFGKPVAVFDVGALGVAGDPSDLISGVNAAYFGLGHFDGAWYDETNLAITAGDFGSPAFVSMLDTTSDPASPHNPVVVSNIAGASAGVAFDREGRLYTGNGFDDGGGSGTGWIKAFDAPDWNVGADFESDGVLIGDVLSAGSLEFDAFGNLVVGGGDFGEFDAGYLGILNTRAIAAALAGHGAIDPLDPAQLKRLDPRGDGLGYFGAVYNQWTGEIYAADGATWYATIPAPGGAALLCAGLAAWRRRRS